VLVLLAIWKTDAILAGLASLRAEVVASDRRLYALVASQAALVTVALILLWGLEREPVVAYMRF
jgi:hypothetical protein